MLNKKIRAFTLAELLVTLALTAVLITLSYSGLNYIQRLLAQYNDQSYFITQITELNKRINYQAGLSREIMSVSENRIVFNSDSSVAELGLYPGFILLKKNNEVDSFLFENSHLILEYEVLNNSDIEVINKIGFDIHFRKQIFHCAFNKNYDGYNKFILESKDAND